MRLRISVLLLAFAGCVDGDALRAGTRGAPAERMDAAADARAADAALDATITDAGASDAAPAGDADPPPDPRCAPETCNDRDDDCDGSVDEGVADCCVPGTQRECGRAVGQCTLGDQFCTVDLVWSACSGDPPGVEICDGLRDEDCDGQIDEQVANACGGCGAAPPERCDGVDDDCDGAVDEGALNACGQCGAVPPERCDGVDDDCDGAVDEGALNACGQCGATPDEICDGLDDDCDGRADEGACYAFVLDDADRAWRAPPGLNASPLVTGRQISAAFATVRGGDTLWVTADGELRAYDVARDRWLEERVADPFNLGRIHTAHAVPAWWTGDDDAVDAAVTVTQGAAYRIYSFDAVARRFSFIRAGTHAEAWEGDPGAPAAFPLRTAVVDLFDNNDYWPGDVRATCGRGGPGPIGAFVSAGRLYTGDAGTCFRFMDDRPVEEWPGFQLPAAPPAEGVVAWAYVNRPDRTGMHIVILDRPADGP